MSEQHEVNKLFIAEMQKHAAQGGMVDWDYVNSLPICDYDDQLAEIFRPKVTIQKPIIVSTPK